MKEIKLFKGEITIVDDDDYELLSQYRWHLDRGYASRTMYTGKIGKKVNLHRLIMPDQLGKVVDHINRNRLDNRKSNLRYVTVQENARNRTKQSNNTSGYIGVIWDTDRSRVRHQRWRAQIKINGKKRAIGRFYTAREAAEARDKVAKEAFGEFAVLNF